MAVVLVFLGGGVGAVVRYLCGIGFARAFGPAPPYLATAGINVAGSLLMGALVGALAHRAGAGGSGERGRLILGVGVLGGFTTFSSFSLEAVLMIERRAYGAAAAYVGGSVALGLLALFAGLVLTRRLLA